MRFLFVKPSQTWPPKNGHDVHGYHMMRALVESGHEVTLATIERLEPGALEELRLTGQGENPTGTEVLDHHAAKPWPEIRLTRLQERFRSYWGIHPAHVAAVGRLAEQYRVDVVVVVGLEVLPLLGAVKKAIRVWYAADEWIWHHLSIVRIGNRSTWAHLGTALVKGTYEFAYRGLVDRAWVVSRGDRRAMRWLAGVRHVDVVPNGVDTDYFAPLDMQTRPNSCVFWGRLDFEPNIQALEWFCRKVWPRLRRLAPDAEFRVFGFSPGPEAKRLSKLPGVTVTADLPDLREHVCREEVAVFPMQSGGGIKNKLLEAASMARPIVCTRRACNGLMLPRDSSPVVEAESALEWCTEIHRLWSEEDRRQHLGSDAHKWVVSAHSWRRSAELAVSGLKPSMADRSGKTGTSVHE